MPKGYIIARIDILDPEAYARYAAAAIKVATAHGGKALARGGRELRGKVGDGVNQAADLISATASIPSLNLIPLTTFGNWF